MMKNSSFYYPAGKISACVLFNEADALGVLVEEGFRVDFVVEKDSGRFTDSTQRFIVRFYRVCITEIYADSFNCIYNFKKRIYILSVHSLISIYFTNVNYCERCFTNSI